MRVVTKETGCQTTEYNISLDTSGDTLPYQHRNFPGTFSKAASARIFVNTRGTSSSKSADSSEQLTPARRSHKLSQESQKLDASQDVMTKEREVVSLKLPDIPLKEGTAGTGKTGELPNSGTRYVPNHKALLRMKGLKYEEAYLHSRSRPDAEKTPRGTSEADLDRSLQQYRKKKALQGPASDQEVEKDFKLPCIHAREGLRDDPDSGSARGSLCSRCGLETIRQNTRDPEFCDPSEEGESSRNNAGLAKHLDQVIEEYMDTPGLKSSKQKNAQRKLGGLVSPVRLIELLKAREPLRMENCFNYYP